MNSLCKNVIDLAKKDGHEVVSIPDVISEKIDGGDPTI